ncbi:GNAT family protein [Polyangium sp. 6x1]|uniref:GNAT family N-acetyltransferase n=1 Tax=Polyangium sp. 6x1 TaxID=3042689 RepID=UPI0024828A5E|nr:GNAT family protein [Polyangium sp. 6x1]MDI1448009.1 GNAT family protein [Polyangium sp. 6x1]
MTMALSAVPRASQVQLVPPRAAHAPLWFGWRSETHAQRHMPIEPWSVDALRRRLVASTPDLADPEKQEHRWIVQWQDECVGIVSILRPSFRLGHAELSYHVAQAHHRRGIAPQAVAALIDRVFEQTDLARLHAYISEPNRPSRRVAEKLGFVHEGTLREHFMIHGRRVDQCVYGLLRREWSSSRKR